MVKWCDHVRGAFLSLLIDDRFDYAERKIGIRCVSQFMVYLIRYYGGYPDGVAFAILLGNICVPLIDHYTRPRVAGHVRGTRS